MTLFYFNIGMTLVGLDWAVRGDIAGFFFKKKFSMVALLLLFIIKSCCENLT